MGIRVEVIEDIKSVSCDRLRARKGQCGTVGQWWFYTYGVGPDAQQYTSFRVKLDGTKNFRDLPNYKLKRIDG